MTEKPPEASAGRPRRLVVVTGTATSVGKTWVTSALARRLRVLGMRVAARKPTQSFSPGERTDAEILASASGEAVDSVCPPMWRYPVPYAPPMAAEVLGRPAPRLAEVTDWLRRWPTGIDVALVETVGGVRSPLCADGDTIDLLSSLVPDTVVLVAPAGLGAINAVRLSVEAIADWPTVVHLNRWDPEDDLLRRNRAWLESEGLTVTVSVDTLVAKVVPGA
jgi:dethiobiotin synthetase